MLIIGLALTGYRDHPLKDLIVLLVGGPGNEDAWGEFFNRFDESIHRIVAAGFRKYFGSCLHSEVCDVVQQVYSRLIENNYRALRSFHGTTEDDFRAYLAKICYNLILDRSRVSTDTIPLTSETASSKEELSSGGHLPVSEPEQERMLERRELRDLIEDSLRRVGRDAEAHRNRLVFILRHYDGYSAQEVADALQITTSHVDVIYHRVKKKIEIDLAKALRKKHRV